MSEESKKKDTYTVSKVTIWQGISAILAIALVVVWVGGNGNEAPGAANAPAPAAQNPTPTQQAPTQPAKVEVSLDDDAMEGDPNAPVEIVEFSDFQCPYCGRWYTQTYLQLRKEYIDTGKVKLVFRDFPLSFHPNAAPAAQAAECARDQGDDETYFKFHDALFENQGSLGDDLYEKIAGDLGLDAGKLKECISSGKFADEVQADFREGGQYGITGTPSFFVNGVKIVGAQPYANFKQVIDAALAE